MSQKEKSSKIIHRSSHSVVRKTHTQLVTIQASVKLEFWENRGGNDPFWIEEKS